MNETQCIVFFCLCFGLMTILFWGVFAIVVRYLFSVFKLIQQIKEEEPDLWSSLGSPTMFPVFHVSRDPFQGLFSQIRFLNWFLRGGEGAETPETKVLVDKTKRLFRMAMVGFVSLFVFSLLFIGFMVLVLETAGLP